MALYAPSIRSDSSSSTATREGLEGLLRERKLDRPLTSTFPARVSAEEVVPFGVEALDALLYPTTQSTCGGLRVLGGLPRGHVSELVGPVSSGRTSLAWTWLGTATARGESAALIDTFDRFDPASGMACGIDLSQLLWVRGQAITKTNRPADPAWLPGARAVDGPGSLLERTIDRSLKALNLVLQSRVCTAVVLDFADVPLNGLRRVPLTTWMRLQRIVEGTDIACLLMGPVPLSRSSGGVPIATGTVPDAPPASAVSTGIAGRARPRRDNWTGAHDRSRRLAGFSVGLRVALRGEECVGRA